MASLSVPRAHDEGLRYVTQERVSLGSASEFRPGTRRLVEAFGTSIAVLNVDGRYVAINNACPHAGGPLICGDVGGAPLPSRPREFRWSEEPVLRCPWHRWEISLESGRTLFDSRIGTPVYPVEVVDGEIFLRPRG